MISKVVLLVFYLIFILLKRNQVGCLKCYVCGNDSNPCADFELNKEKFVQECKTSDRGCFLETKGAKKTTRSCNSQGLNDCQTANKVEYCFCSTDLCNDNGGKFFNPTDDEDLLDEGSGTKQVSPVTVEPKVIAKGSSSKLFSKDECLQFSLILYFAIMY
nr:uncharacterized protein LOC111505721 [Leptinotarsa decemlineata]